MAPRSVTLAVRSATLVLGFMLALPAASQARLEVHVLAHVPAPGYPANALVASDGTIYAGTFKSFSASSDNGPSKVFAFAPDGKLLRSYKITGQTPGVAHGIQVAARDRAGVLYLLDQDPARVLKLDPRTGAQTTWATFMSLPACGPGVPAGACSDGSGGNAPEPDFAAWGPDGSLYVTDYTQALIWRVPPRGGAASVWLTDARFNGVVVGPAGLELLGDRHTLMLSTGGGGSNPSTGKLYTIPIGANGRAGALHQIWESAGLEAPDGFAVARSGNVYIALVGPGANAVVELSPAGKEVARVPANAVANDAMTVPFDAPGSVTFDGDNIIVANQSAINNNTAHMALLEIAVGERGLPISLPPVTGSAYRLTVVPARPIAGRRTSFRFSATVSSGGRPRPLVGGLVRFAGFTVPTDVHGSATITVVLHRHVRPYGAALVLGGRTVARVAISTTVAVRRARGQGNRTNAGDAA